MHTVAVLALDGVNVFDLATPIEVFGRTVRVDGLPAYDVFVAGPAPTATSRITTLSVSHTLAQLVEADTVIIPGRDDPTLPIDPCVIEALQAAAARGARIASICVGALDLAATSLLDGLRATTHWRAARLMATRHPNVDVDAAALYIDNGQLLCSAGAAAGVDLCLYIVALDFGGIVAAETARSAVVPLTRDAGQAQYIRDDELGSLGLSATLAWIEAHATEPLTVAAIARSASVSTRTLNRRFADELGTTPSGWLNRARVRRAQTLLETTDWSVERIARESGLGSAQNFRSRFADLVGTSPSRYRSALVPTREPESVELVEFA